MARIFHEMRAWLTVCVSFCVRTIHRFWNWYLSWYKSTRWWTKATAAFCTLIFLLVFYVFSVKVNLFWLFGKSPSAYDIMHPENPEASEIFTADGQLIGKFFDENRVSVPYDSINPVFFDALISTEDERFYEHFGIDVQGIFAAMKDALSGNARGASTISQQLVKNMFRIRTNYSTGLLGSLPGFSILVKKSKEMIIAVQLEAMNDKKDILQMYANTVDFGSNAYGIKIAAKTYFNTTPSQLKTEEAAVLVGLLKATSTYNPRLHPEKSLERRNVVLDNMCRLGKLSRSACDSLKRLPIKLDYSVESAYDGGVLYFRAPLLEYIREKCPDLDPYTDGLKIYTTLDSKMQRFAEEAVNEQMRSLQDKFVRHWQGVGDPWRDASGRVLPDFIENIARKTSQYKVLAKKFNGVEDSIFKYLEIPHKVHVFDYDGGRDVEMSTMDSIRYMVKFLHTGFVTMEPQTGYVRSYVGDIDFDTWKYDKVQAQRQPGSTFKLFVYAEAMEQGLTPRDTRLDAQVRMEVYDKQKDTTTIWQPHNANGVITYAQLPLRSAFATSVNTIAVNLGQEVGIGNVIKRAKAMGVRSPLREIPSLPLGACDVNLFEMVNAYGTVANEGRQVEPVLVEKIVDRNGKVVFTPEVKDTIAMSYRAAFYMQQMLKAGTTDPGGTSMALANHRYMGKYRGKIDFGGKTGTSNNHSDAWFIGVTPRLVGGAWVGSEYRSIHFRTGALGQGSRTALPIFGLFMNKVLSDSSLAARYMCLYPKPKEEIDPQTYEYVNFNPADTIPALDVETMNIVDLQREGEEISLDDMHAPAASDTAAVKKNAAPSADEGENRDDGGNVSGNEGEDGN